MPVTGSSPQVRGAQRVAAPAAARLGLIPAGAGSTRPRRRPWRCPRAHPRRCGEHTLARVSANRPAGSSPQVRGAPRPGQAHPRPHGLIPAGAGSTISEALLPAGLRGSSPQVRGARRTHWWRCCPPAAHPRRCGEHWHTLSRGLQEAGSSPQVRGARSGARRCWSRGGLIPAGAGSTTPCTIAKSMRQAHPRRCGEHEPPEASDAYRMGSSPQVRGAPFCGCVGVGGVGLIPAGAGSTTMNPGSSWKYQAHPRRCGEHAARTMTGGGVGWAHPRRCGEHLRAVGRLPRRAGLIPAGAGSTRWC